MPVSDAGIHSTDLDEIENSIRTGTLAASLIAGKSDAPMVSDSREQVKVPFAYDLGSCARAIAKSALNFVCAAVDRDLARRAELDVLRTFVNTGLGDFQRFVNFRFGQAAPTPEEAALSYLGKSGFHTVLVTGSGGIPLVFFFLFSRLFAIVKLCDTPILARDRQVLGLFDYRAQTHRTFDTQRNAAELVRTFFPTGIGNVSV